MLYLVVETAIILLITAVAFFALGTYYHRRFGSKSITVETEEVTGSWALGPDKSVKVHTSNDLALQARIAQLEGQLARATEALATAAEQPPSVTTIKTDLSEVESRLAGIEAALAERPASSPHLLSLAPEPQVPTAPNYGEELMRFEATLDERMRSFEATAARTLEEAANRLAQQLTQQISLMTPPSSVDHGAMPSLDIPLEAPPHVTDEALVALEDRLNATVARGTAGIVERLEHRLVELVNAQRPAENHTAELVRHLEERITELAQVQKPADNYTIELVHQLEDRITEIANAQAPTETSTADVVRQLEHRITELANTPRATETNTAEIVRHLEHRFTEILRAQRPTESSAADWVRHIEAPLARLSAQVEALSSAPAETSIRLQAVEEQLHLSDRQARVAVSDTRSDLEIKMAELATDLERQLEERLVEVAPAPLPPEPPRAGPTWEEATQRIRLETLERELEGLRRDREDERRRADEMTRDLERLRQESLGDSLEAKRSGPSPEEIAQRIRLETLERELEGLRRDREQERRRTDEMTRELERLRREPLDAPVEAKRSGPSPEEIAQRIRLETLERELESLRRDREEERRRADEMMRDLERLRREPLPAPVEFERPGPSPEEIAQRIRLETLERELEGLRRDREAERRRSDEMTWELERLRREPRTMTAPAAAVQTEPSPEDERTRRRVEELEERLEAKERENDERERSLDREYQERIVTLEREIATFESKFADQERDQNLWSGSDEKERRLEERARTLEAKEAALELRLEALEEAALSPSLGDDSRVRELADKLSATERALTRAEEKRERDAEQVALDKKFQERFHELEKETRGVRDEIAMLAHSLHRETAAPAPAPAQQQQPAPVAAPTMPFPFPFFPGFPIAGAPMMAHQPAAAPQPVAAEHGPCTREVTNRLERLEDLLWEATATWKRMPVATPPQEAIVREVTHVAGPQGMNDEDRRLRDAQMQTLSRVAEDQEYLRREVESLQNTVRDSFREFEDRQGSQVHDERERARDSQQESRLAEERRALEMERRTDELRRDVERRIQEASQEIARRLDESRRETSAEGGARTEAIAALGRRVDELGRELTQRFREELERSQAQQPTPQPQPVVMQPQPMQLPPYQLQQPFYPPTISYKETVMADRNDLEERLNERIRNLERELSKTQMNGAVAGANAGAGMASLGSFERMQSEREAMLARMRDIEERSRERVHALELQLERARAEKERTAAMRPPEVFQGSYRGAPAPDMGYLDRQLEELQSRVRFLEERTETSRTDTGREDLERRIRDIETREREKSFNSDFATERSRMETTQQIAELRRELDSRLRDAEDRALRYSSTSSTNAGAGTGTGVDSAVLDRMGVEWDRKLRDTVDELRAADRRVEEIARTRPEPTVSPSTSAVADIERVRQDLAHFVREQVSALDGRIAELRDSKEVSEPVSEALHSFRKRIELLEKTLEEKNGEKEETPAVVGLANELKERVALLEEKEREQSAGMYADIDELRRGFAEERSALERRFQQRIEAMETAVAHMPQATVDTTANDEWRAAVDALKNEQGEAAEQFQKQMLAMREYVVKLDKAAQPLEERLAKLESGVSADRFNELATDVQRAISESRTALDSIGSQVAQVERALADAAADSDKRFEQLREKYEDRVEDLVSHIDHLQEEMRDEAEERENASGGEDTREMITQIESTQQHRFQDIETRFDRLQKELDTEVAEVKVGLETAKAKTEEIVHDEGERIQRLTADRLQSMVKGLEGLVTEKQRLIEAMSDQLKHLEEQARQNPDDLEQIMGIGPKLKKKLRDEFQITTFKDLATMSGESLQRLATLLLFPDRIFREDWIGQARELHLRKYNELLPPNESETEARLQMTAAQ